MASPVGVGGAKALVNGSVEDRGDAVGIETAESLVVQVHPPGTSHKFTYQLDLGGMGQQGRARLVEHRGPGPLLTGKHGTRSTLGRCACSHNVSIGWDDPRAVWPGVIFFGTG